MIVTILALALATAAPFHRLHAEKADASSFLRSNWNKYEENYHPSYVLDDDPKTAWVDGVDGDGVGESITIPVSQLASARTVRLVIINGYQKRKDLFAANGAPSDATIVVTGPGGKASGTLKAKLKDAMGKQTFDVPVTAGVATVTLTLDAVRAGTKYADTCISDIEVWVDSDAPYVPAVEQRKHTALLKWKTKRLVIAKKFANLPPTYPFASTQFVHKVRDIDTPDDFSPSSPDDALEAIRKKEKVPKAVADAVDDLIGGPSGAVPVAVTMKGTVVQPTPPDGVDLLAGWASLTDITLFEAKGDVEKRDTSWLGDDCDDTHGGPGCELVGETITRKPVALWAGEGAARHVQSIYYESKEHEDARNTVDRNVHTLFQYDAQQHLVVAAEWEDYTSDEMNHASHHLRAVHIVWNKDGKVEKVTQYTSGTEGASVRESTVAPAS